MAHTMIASKAVDRMLESEDEFAGLQLAIERDFMGRFPRPGNWHILMNPPRLERCPNVQHVVRSRYHGHQVRQEE